MVKLLHTLIENNHEYVKSKRLKQSAGYTSEDTYKSQIHRLKKWGRKVCRADVNLLEGTSGSGYRIPPSISIQRLSSGTK